MILAWSAESTKEAVMNQQLKEIRGKEVVALEEGRDMGTIHRVFLDPKTKRVSGITVRESRFGNDDKWLDINKVKHFGEDYLFVAMASDCTSAEPKGTSLKDLIGTQVKTKDGKNLGLLEDVEIDHNWEITEIDLSGHCTVKIEKQETVIGEDTILLKAGTEILPEDCRERKQGFLARMFGVEVVQSRDAAHPQPKKKATGDKKKMHSQTSETTTKSRQDKAQKSL